MTGVMKGSDLNWHQDTLGRGCASDVDHSCKHSVHGVTCCYAGGKHLSQSWMCWVSDATADSKIGCQSTLYTYTALLKLRPYGTIQICLLLLFIIIISLIEQYGIKCTAPPERFEVQRIVLPVRGKQTFGVTRRPHIKTPIALEPIGWIYIWNASTTTTTTV